MSASRSNPSSRPRLTRRSAEKEALAPPEGTWQLALSDPRSGSAISRQISSGALKNVTRAPSTIVAMTVEFGEAAATPTG
jgi:hypothetical protein